MSTFDVTVVTPSIPPRAWQGGLLERAVGSVRGQTVQPAGGHVVILDVDKAGAAVTRQRGLDAVRTGWVAFLDDDDYLYPQHIEVLSRLVTEHDAVHAYSWFAGNNPFPMHRGRKMNIHEPHHTTMTVMVRTDVARAAGFYLEKPLHQDWMGEDWQFELRCIAEIRRLFGDDVAPSKIVGTDEVTWHYSLHGGNTSGLPTRW